MAKVFLVSEWKWFGVAGHFIGSPFCSFHLCTQVGKFLISTVGEYDPLQKYRLGDGNWMEIGCDRLYETMVFRAGEPCNREGCKCGLPTIDGNEILMEPYNSRKDADAGHLRICQEYSSMENQHA